jgi:hypothetical protein
MQVISVWVAGRPFKGRTLFDPRHNIDGHGLHAVLMAARMGLLVLERLLCGFPGCGGRWRCECLSCVAYFDSKLSVLRTKCMSSMKACLRISERTSYVRPFSRELFVRAGGLCLKANSLPRLLALRCACLEQHTHNTYVYLFWHLHVLFGNVCDVCGVPSYETGMQVNYCSVACNTHSLFEVAGVFSLQ